MLSRGWRWMLVGVVLALVCALPAARAAAASDGASALHSQIERALKEEGLAGAVWATVDSDGATRTGAAGPRDIVDWQGRYVPAPNRFAAFRYVDFLFDSPRLAWDGTVLRFSPAQGPMRRLAPAGGMTFTANDRSTASHVLLQGEGGQRLLSDGFRTYRQVPAALYWLVATSLAFGLLGLLWFGLAVPARALMRREPVGVPGVVAVALLLLPVPLFLLQSYTQLGDRTAASLALYGVTAALPLLMLWQAWRSACRHEGLAHGRVNLVAALLVLQWCAVLAGWGMLPFALWR